MPVDRSELLRRGVRRARRGVQRPLDRLGTALLAPPRTWPGDVLLHGDRTAKRIALTYDDGPSLPSTDAMLDVLADRGVRATFFVLGEMVEWYPDTLRRAAHEGHVIGNHSMYHARRGALAPTGADHIDRSAEIIESVVGRRPALYRPPWGWATPWEMRRLRARGMTVVGWDVYPDDWKDPETPAVVTCEQVCSRVAPGSIVLMHDATSRVRHCAKTQSAAATAMIVDRLQADGYEFVTVDELLGVTAYVDRVAMPASGA